MGEGGKMTPEQKAAAYSASKKCLDFENGDPIAEAWLDGHRATADSYIADATIQGMQEEIDNLLDLTRVLLAEKKRAMIEQGFKIPVTKLFAKAVLIPTKQFYSFEEMQILQKYGFTFIQKDDSDQLEIRKEDWQGVKSTVINSECLRTLRALGVEIRFVSAKTELMIERF
jgi:hypothetical protein